jgi:hypothetical protein
MTNSRLTDPEILETALPVSWSASRSAAAPAAEARTAAATGSSGTSGSGRMRANILSNRREIPARRHLRRRRRRARHQPDHPR